MSETAATAARETEPRLYRSALFVPGNRARMIEKAIQSDADALYVDLEDAVAPAEKEAARRLVGESIPSMRNKLVIVRVNDLSTGLTGEDFDAIVQPDLHGVLVPKIDTPDDVKIVDYLLFAAEKRKGLPEGYVEIHATIETVAGVSNCREIFRASSRIKGIACGVAEDGDLQKELGYRWTSGALETLYFRSRVLLEARAAKVPNLIEGPYVRHQDEEGLRREASFAAQLGYTGKAAIHPRQIAIINEVFSPSEEELAYYRRVIAAMEDAYAQGLAAVTFEGKMIDTAMLARAKRVVAFADRITPRTAG